MSDALSRLVVMPTNQAHRGLVLTALALLVAMTTWSVAHATPPRARTRTARGRAARAVVVPSLADRVPRLPGGAPIVITPVLFVPSDGSYARWTEADAAMRAHVAIAQQHYRALLGTTFAAASTPLPIVRGEHTAAEYEADAGTRANAITSELFAWARTDRYASHHVFVVLYASSTPITGGGGTRAS